MTGADSLRAAVASLGPPGRADPTAVRAHLDALAKPPGSLGLLESVALRLALVRGFPPAPLARRRVLVFAADHGVAARGVSAYPPEVTRSMCALFATGGAAIDVLARQAGATVTAVDVGVDAPTAIPGVVDRRVRRGTRDLSAGPALSPAEVEAALAAGFEVATEAAADSDVIALGDMGIGNTTAAAAVTCALTGAAAHDVVGPGTGIGAEALARKRRVVARACRRLRGAEAADDARNAGSPPDPRAVLAEVGGLEIAAIAGAVIGCAHAGIPVVTDGFIVTAGVLAAVALCPAAHGYVFASHRSAEPGHAVQLRALGLDPLLAMGMRLGEGTGAALALPILDAAGSILREMATLERALEISRYRDARGR